MYCKFTLKFSTSNPHQLRMSMSKPLQVGNDRIQRGILVKMKTLAIKEKRKQLSFAALMVWLAICYLPHSLKLFCLIVLVI